jgi:hypothetical protein
MSKKQNNASDPVEHPIPLNPKTDADLTMFE